MPKAYVILTEAINDRAAMAAYEAASTAPLIDHRGKVLVVDEEVQVLEGAWPGTRTVVVEFDSVATARAWYESPAYGAARPLRQAAADCNVVIVEAFTPPAQ
jgi:uncharacterized protein (DUF1330 family)